MASAGFSRRRNRSRLKRAVLIAFLASCSSTAFAKSTTFDIAAGPLDAALLNLARQSGADIATTEGGLHSVTTRPLSGRMSVGEALNRLLAGSGYRAVPIGGSGFRIVRATSAAHRAPRPAGVRLATIEDVGDIVVTGTKQHVSLLRFPGSVQFVGRPFLPSGAGRSASMDDVARMTPILQKTELGAGRNKLFIRGISDSSFNGPTQSTAAIYFGDVPLGYAGPEPALNLYDMSRVEILEGPQGTLYGAGAIGGVVRLTPNAPDLTQAEAAMSGGSTVTQNGEPGFDGAAMINLPIVKDKVALRLVGYGSRDGGFIDDDFRVLNDINRADTIGGRASLRIEPGDGWSLETGILNQQIKQEDAGYTDIGAEPLHRRSSIAQPFSNRILLAREVVTKSWDSGLQLVSATGLVAKSASDTFNLTRVARSPIPIAYQVDSNSLLLSQETRLSRSSANGTSWVAGFLLLYNRDAQDRNIGPPGSPTDIIGVTNITRSAALFGEVTLPVTRRFSVTLGARATGARTDGEPSTKPREEPVQEGRLTRRIEPTIAVSWLLASDLAAFARVQSGYRTGGIAVARGIGRVADFLPDSIIVGEIGLRKERRGTRGIAFSTSFSYARWNSIQADLFSRYGQPYTDNIGDARIGAVEASGDWIPAQGWRISAAMLYTENETSGVLATSSTARNRRLPETPPLSASLGLSREWTSRSGRIIALEANGRYVGRSVLGTGEAFDQSQGKYVNLDASASWRWRNMEVSLSGNNLMNMRGTLFAMGNPVSYSFRDQSVPLRPRNVRLGFAYRW